MNDSVEIDRTMRTLKGLGVGLSFDDFGTAGCGCDVYQGHLFSKPLPAENFAELLRKEPLPWR